MKKKIIIIFIWILLWQGISLLVGNRILLVGPWETLRALGGLAVTGEFWQSLGWTLLRLLLGILLGTGLGFCVAYLAGRKPLLREFLQPAVHFMKAIPVVSFVILLLIWAGNTWVAFYVVCLVTFPIAYLNMLSGLSALDPKLTEMARVFRMPFGRRFRYVELPQLRPGLSAALALTVGMGFKSGIAAEVIGQALHTIGNEMYRSKIYLETADLFAWTAVVILCSWGTEKLLQWVLRRVGSRSIGG